MGIDSEYIAGVIAAFAEDQAKASESKDENEALIERRFTHSVDALKNYPNNYLSSLGCNIWDIFHYGHMRLAVGKTVKNLMIAIVPARFLVDLGFNNVKKGNHGVLLAPDNWMDMWVDNPFIQFGSVINIGSQIVDFYNNRLNKYDLPNEIERRARSYEAEYIKHLSINLNTYQINILKEFPFGFDHKLLYDLKPISIIN